MKNDDGIAIKSTRASGALHIPNIDEVQGTASVGHIDHYAPRVLGTLRCDDYLLLSAELVPVLTETLGRFHAIGVTDFPASHIISVPMTPGSTLCESVLEKPQLLELIDALPVTFVEPFEVSTQVMMLCRLTHKMLSMNDTVAKRWNNKEYARTALHAAGIATPPCYPLTGPFSYFAEQALSAVRRLRVLGHTSFSLTVTESCSGQGIFRFDTEEEVLRLLDLMAETRTASDPPLMVEPWIDGVVASPSFVTYIRDDAEHDVEVCVSDQILDGTVHLGNSSPSRYAGDSVFLELKDHVIEVLRACGVRGYCGVDLLATGLTQPRFYVSEVNCRQTGSTYAGILAKKLRDDADLPWYGHNNLLVPKGTTVEDLFDHLEHAGIAYSPATREGVLPINAANMVHGKAMVVILAAAPERIAELREIVINLFQD